MTGQRDTNGTTIVKEYPGAYTGQEGQIPYYAILDQENIAIYQQYVEALKRYPNFYLLGRLAEYQYYNIDAIVKKSLELSNYILRKDNK